MNPRTKIVDQIYKILQSELTVKKLAKRIEKSSLNINDESQLPAVSISINKENYVVAVEKRDVNQAVPQSRELFLIIRILTNGDDAEVKNALIQNEFEDNLFCKISDKLLSNENPQGYYVGKFRLNEFAVETDKQSYIASYDISVVYHQNF